jgi:hypothetical protein
MNGGKRRQPSEAPNDRIQDFGSLSKGGIIAAEHWKSIRTQPHRTQICLWLAICTQAKTTEALDTRIWYGAASAAGERVGIFASS